jgi:hypothetical protein
MVNKVYLDQPKYNNGKRQCSPQVKEVQPLLQKLHLTAAQLLGKLGKQTPGGYGSGIF